MSLVLGIIPFAVLILILLTILGWLEVRVEENRAARQEAIIYAVAAWGFYLAVASEGLGSIRWINRPALLVVWVVPLLLLAMFGLRKGYLQVGLRALQQGVFPPGLSRWEIGLTAAFAIWILVLFLIAWISPPNNNDSLGYHMARVAHWAQNGSLAHYPTAYEFQLYNAIWAELVILQTYVLSAADRFANLVQWLSMVGSVAMVMGIARLLGARQSGQILAGAFVLTIPMGVLQASSTQTDYVAAFWLSVLAYLAVKSNTGGLSKLDIPALGASIGLGMMTKGTYYPYALPFLLWLFVPLLWRLGWRKTFLIGISTACIALALNTPFWVRNYTTFHSLLGPEWWVEEKSPGDYRPGTILANMARNLSIHYGTPIPALNNRIRDAIVSLCQRLGQAECVTLRDSEQYTYRIPLTSNHEDSAGNPIHLTLIIGSLVLIAIFYKKLTSSQLLVVYGLALVVAYGVLSATILWELYGSRYQFPFFVLAGPLCGTVLGGLVKPKPAYILAGLLLLASLPWLVFNRTRPLVGWTPRVTLVGSIFTTPRADLLFANQAPLQQPYTQVVEAFLQTGCRNLGLKIDSHDPEYLFWSLVEPQKRNIRIEVVYYDPKLQRYADPAFQPCAVICTLCGQKDRQGELPLVFSSGEVNLYLRPAYSAPAIP